MDPKVLVAEGEELTELYEDSNGHLPQSLRDMGINNIKDLGRFNLPGGQSVSSHVPFEGKGLQRDFQMKWLRSPFRGKVALKGP